MRLKEHGQRTVEMKKDRFKEVFNFLTLKPPEPVIKKNFLKEMDVQNMTHLVTPNFEVRPLNYFLCGSKTTHRKRAKV